MNASSHEIVRSYRTLYRQALRAVQYSQPARSTLKILIRGAYRAGKPAEFDPRKIEKTLIFLQCATKEKGLEHKIVKSLLHTWWWDKNGRGYSTRGYTPDQSPRGRSTKEKLLRSPMQHFEITLKMLNETMGMCLPTRMIKTQDLPEVHHGPLTWDDVEEDSKGE